MIFWLGGEASDDNEQFKSPFILKITRKVEPTEVRHLRFSNFPPIEPKFAASYVRRFAATGRLCSLETLRESVEGAGVRVKDEDFSP